MKNETKKEVKKEKKRFKKVIRYEKIDNNDSNEQFSFVSGLVFGGLISFLLSGVIGDICIKDKKKIEEYEEI
jgi:hypothetical protein